MITKEKSVISPFSQTTKGLEGLIKASPQPEQKKQGNMLVLLPQRCVEGGLGLSIHSHISYAIIPASVLAPCTEGWSPSAWPFHCSAQTASSVKL